MILPDELKQSVLSVVEKPVNAAIASTGTAAVGSGTYYEMLPKSMGEMASAIGIVVSLVLLYFAWCREKRERKRAKIENQILISREAERQAVRKAGGTQ